MTFPTHSNLSISDVRSVSETENIVIMTRSTKSTLLEILTLLDALVDYGNPTVKKLLFEDVAERLSKIAGKEPAWSWRYVQSVVSGTVEPSKKFSSAVQALAVSLDGIPVPFAKSSPVTVYAETGTVSDGAFLMAASQRCVNPSCTVTFIPNVPWRKLCPICSPLKKQ